MKLPAYILEYEDQVPLAGSNFLLDISLAEAQFLDLAITKSPDRKIVFLIRRSANERDFSEIQVVLDDVFAIGPVGLLTEKEPTDAFILYSFNIFDRFEVTSIESDSDGVPWVEGHFVIEDFSPLEQELPSLMMSIYSNLLEHQHILQPSVAKSLSSTTLLLRKMDILANFLLTSSDSRTIYLQRLDNTERWNQVVQALRAHIQNGRPAPKKPAKSSGKPIRQIAAEPLTLSERVNALPLPFEIRHTISRENDKLDRLTKSSTEYSMITDYLTWVTDIPWNQYSAKEFELLNLKTQLDKSHYGLEEIKDYIVEHFCIEQITKRSAGSVLCFSGPPGTGKTTIAKEIAAVSGRPLIRIALGGLTDEAEIRG